MTPAEEAVYRSTVADIEGIISAGGMALGQLCDIRDRLAKHREHLLEVAGVCSCGEPNCKRAVCVDGGPEAA